MKISPRQRWRISSNIILRSPEEGGLKIFRRRFATQKRMRHPMNFDVDGGVSSSCKCRARCTRVRCIRILFADEYEIDILGDPTREAHGTNKRCGHRRGFRANIKCVLLWRLHTVLMWKRPIAKLYSSHAWGIANKRLALIDTSTNCSWNPNVAVLWYISSMISNFDGRTHMLLILVGFSTGRTILCCKNSCYLSSSIIRQFYLLSVWQGQDYTNLTYS